jgi:Tn3 transposase DDE domain
VTIENGALKITPIEKSTPPEAEALAARLYDMLPRIRVTDLLAEVARCQQEREPFEAAFGSSSVSSSDGQFFQAAGSGRDAGRLNAHYSLRSGFKVYTHLSGRYGPYFTTDRSNSERGAACAGRAGLSSGRHYNSPPPHRRRR